MITQHCRSAVCTLLLVCLWLVVAGRAEAQDRTGVPAIERIDLPDERTADWPEEVRAKKLVTVLREEFERLWRNSQPRQAAPTQAALDGAVYRGELRGSDLRGVEFQLDIRRTMGSTTWMMLEPWTPALAGVRWKEAPAVWGQGGDGHTWLRVDRELDSLTGQWSLHGDQRGDGAHFAWSSPPAAYTRIELKVPAGLLVTAEPGTVRRSAAQAGDSTWQWEIALGPQSQTRLTIAPEPPSVPGQPRVLVEQEITCGVNENDIRFQASFQLDVYDAPIQDLTVQLPSGVEIYSASYGGELPLNWTVNEADGRRQITLRLPDPVLGRSRKIKIEGVSLQRVGQSVSAPQLSIQGGIFYNSVQTFVVAMPLEIRSIRGSGFRQQTPLLPSPTAHTVTFGLLGPEGQVLLDVRKPQDALTTRVFSQLTLREDDWSSITDIAWSATSGTVFQTACRIPAGWEVSDVQPAPWITNSRLAGWDLQTGAAGAATLALEFYEAISPGNPRGVRLFLRRVAPVLPQGGPPPVPLPATDGDLEEFALAVLSSPGLQVHTGGAANLDQLAATSIPQSWNGTAALLPTDRQATLSAQWFRSGQADTPGELEIEAGLPASAPGCETLAEAGASGIRVDFRIRPVRSAEPGSRTLWYVTGPSTSIVWSAGGVPLTESAIKRLPTEQHGVWKLPTTGSLWEWIPPSATPADVTITGTLTLRWNDQTEVPLVLLPNSPAVSHQVTLVRTPPEAVAFSDQGLSLQSFVDAAPMESRAASGDRRVWLYSDLTSRLQLTRRQLAPELPTPMSASMELHSLISANYAGVDLHRATLTVLGQADGESLFIHLPATARLLNLTLDGERLSQPPADQRIRVPLSDDRLRRTLEVLYEEPAAAQFLVERRAVVPPQLSCPVSVFRWEFSSPPQTVLQGAPTGVILQSPLSSPGWSERLFGPLGRTAGEGLFNPLSPGAWRDLWPERQRRSVGVGLTSEGFAVPQGWRSWVATSPTAPSSIVLVTWDGIRLRLAAWLIFLVTAIAGLLMRMRALRVRNRIAALWLAPCLALIVFAPAPVAVLAGSALSGMMLSMLAPRSVLRAARWETPKPVASSVPGGSTQSFRYSPPIAAVLITVTLAAATAQSPMASETAARVYVPVGKDGEPSELLPVVYAEASLIETLRRAGRVVTEPPQWLLSSASYEIDVAPDRSAEVRATFEVAFGDGWKGGELRLPLRGGFLKSREGCRVNGQSVAAVRMEGDQGWLIPVAPLPAGEAVGSSTVRVQLDVATPPGAPDGSAVNLSIPPVSQSRAVIQWSGGSGWSLAGVNGETLPLPAGGLKAQLGNQQELRLLPGHLAEAASIPARVEMELVQTVDCRAAWSEVRFRCRGTTTQGNFESLRLEVPATAVVREVRGDALGAYRSHRQDGTQQVVLEFQPGQRPQWLLEGTLLIPQNPGEPDRPVPLVWPISTERLQVTRQTTYCGLGTTTDFRLEPREQDDPALSPISNDDFIQKWGDTGLTVEPRLTYQVQSGKGTPSVRLTAAGVQRRALRWNQTGTIKPRRMEWVLQGELETTGGVWSHTLVTTDHRLRIESVSVEENGAERLLTRAESRINQQNRIVLFLRDRTSGTQNIIVRASSAVRPGTPMPLPSIYCEGASLIDGRVNLYCDPELTLEMPLVRGLERLQGAAEIPAEAEGPTLFGRFQLLEPDVKAILRVQSRLGRCSTRNAVVFSPVDPGIWRLRGRLEMSPADPATRDLACDFPADWGSQFEFTVEGARAELQAQPGGTQRILLQRRNAGPEPVQINYAVDLPLATGRDWSLSLPLPQQSPHYETIVGLTENKLWAPSSEQATLSQAAIPDWAAALWNDWLPDVPLVLFRPRRETLQLVRQAVAASPQAQEISYVEHRLRLDQRDGIAGSTLVLVKPGNGLLEITLPPEIRLLSALEGDRPLALLTEQPGQIRLKLEGAGGATIVVLTWTRLWDSGWSPMEQLVESLPIPAGGIPAAHWVSVETPESDWLMARAGINSHTGLDLALARLESILQSVQPGSLSDWQRRLIQSGYAQLAAELPRVIERGKGLRPDQAERWRAIVDAINEQQLRVSTSGDDSSPLWQAAANVPVGLAGEVTSDSGTIRFWRARRQELDWWFVLPAAALLAAVLLRWLRLPYAEWLQARPAAAWLALGLVWWLLLSPSLLGLGMLGLAAVLHFRRPAIVTTATLVS